MSNIQFGGDPPPPKPGTNGVRRPRNPNDGCCDNLGSHAKDAYDKIPPYTSKKLISIFSLPKICLFLVKNRNFG